MPSFVQEVLCPSLNRIAIPLIVLLLGGCGTTPDAIVTSTGTVIGIEGSQSPTNSSPAATIGYKRAEFAYVPIKLRECTKEGGEESCDERAFETPNVLMELYFKTLLQSQLYQRLAIGEKAVAQDGAAIIFAKNADGTISTQAVAIAASNDANLAFVYGCDEACKKLAAFWAENPDAGRTVNTANEQKIEGCMRDNGLLTGSGRVGEFLSQSKFAGIWHVCVAALKL